MEAVQVLSQLKNIKSYIRLIYKNCVESVNPKLLVHQELKKKGNTLIVRGKEYQIDKNCYVVGFGKAVLDMALASETILGEHIREGALSVPEGLLTENKSLMPRVIKVFEGAKNNIPDEKALLASKSIVNILEPLKENDLLIVLVSGGGSALLPYPIPPVTLEEKRLITTSLALAGANIIELNAVRKRLSLVKGGRLAKMAYPAKIISLILSDVVNDPLEIIACGPTVPDKLPQSMAIDVLSKYDLMKELPNHVKYLLQKTENEEHNFLSHCTNYIIGNNSLALKAGEDFTAKDGFVSKIMTCSLAGRNEIIAESFATLAGLICQALGKTINNLTFTNELNILSKDLCINKQEVEELTNLIFKPSSKNKICLFFGGETTVKVTGNGIGGRNQEMALRFSYALDELSKTLHVIDLFNVVMLCAGTDGIDGPTDAAGAIAYNGQSVHAMTQSLSAQEYLKNNDSYKYYSLLNNGEDILKCGITGTNVMDINILTVQSKI